MPLIVQRKYEKVMMRDRENIICKIQKQIRINSEMIKEVLTGKSVCANFLKHDELILQRLKKIYLQYMKLT